MRILTMASFGAFLLFLPYAARAIEVAITVDDPGMESVGVYSFREINQRMLSTLKKNRVQAALFVCGKRVDSTSGKALLKEWDLAGHWIGSHSYSHLNLHEESISTKDYIQDIDKNSPIVQGAQNFQKLFRFPFLKEGNTVEKRDAVRKHLANQGFRNGYVTIDTSDWAISSRLKEAIQSGRKDLEPYKKYYITHMIDRLKYYDGLATKTLGRDIKHTLLIHHNVLNALFLDDLIQAFKKSGVQFIDANQAYADPVFQEQPDFLPAGESLIWMLSKRKNPELVDLRYPAEDGKYIEGDMNRLGL